jgi:hypothetical protein
MEDEVVLEDERGDEEDELRSPAVKKKKSM